MQPLDEPIGARCDLQAGDDGARISEAAVGVFELDRYVSDFSRSRFDGVGAHDERPLLGNVRSSNGAAGRGGNLPRQAFVRQQIGAVGKDVDYETGVADRHRVQKLAAWLRGDAERHDAFVILPQPELLDRGAIGSLYNL